MGQVAEPTGASEVPEAGSTERRLYIHNLSATVSPLSARPFLVPSKHNAQALAVGTRDSSASEKIQMGR